LIPHKHIVHVNSDSGCLSTPSTARDGPLRLIVLRKLLALSVGSNRVRLFGKAIPGIIQRKFLELHSCALCDELWKKVAGETAFILRVPVKAILVHDIYSFIILSSFHSLTKFFLVH
jgi:hypothetical protein